MLKRLLLLAIGAILITGGSFASVSAQENEWLLAPTGPYQVGTTFYHWIDETRDETLTDDPNDKRELVVQIWYPAEVEEGAIPIPYFPHGEADIRGFEVSHRKSPLIRQTPTADIAQVPTHSYLNAPVAGAQPTYPVVFHAPFPLFQIARLQDLASHGYVVVGTYLPHVWSWTVFPDGREVVTKMGTSRFLEAQPALLEIGAQDNAFILDQLKTLNMDDRFYNRLTLDQVGIIGDGWGAQLAMVTALRDSRFKAVIATISAGGFPSVIAKEKLDRPILFLDSEEYPSKWTVKNMEGPAYMVTLNGMTDFNASDFGIIPGMSEFFKENELGEVDSVRAIEIVNAYTRAFFEQYLLDADTSLPNYPETEIQTFNLED
jgi:dienelactone hydrolase